MIEPITAKDLLYFIVLVVSVIGSYYKMQNKIEIVRNDLLNHKINTDKLEIKVGEHENKIDQRLASLDRKIDDKHEILNGKMDELKNLLIEKIK